MRILVLSDFLVDSKVTENSFKKVFPSCRIDFLKWDVPANIEQLHKVMFKIESEGPTSVKIPEGLLEKIVTWNPKILITQFAPVPREVICAGRALKIVGVMRSGTENVNVEASTKKGVLVFNTVGRNANAVAEFTVGLILSETRNIARGYAGLKQGEWGRNFPTGELSFELAGRIVGIIGFGRIGQLVAEKLRLGFKANILAYDPFVSDETMKQLRVQKCSLETLLAHSDIITIHARLMPQTKELIGKKEISQIKPKAFLINTARAGLINKESLLDALREKRIMGAALDVFWEEPIDPNDPLTGLDNVTLTPHYAGFTEKAYSKSPLLLANELKSFLEKGIMKYVVNPNVAKGQAKTSLEET